MSQERIESDKKKARAAMALSRRQFLRNSAGVASLLALGPVLSACDPSALQAPAQAPAADNTSAASGPKQGGTLVFAAESVGESLEPGLWNGFGVANILDNVGDGLTRPQWLPASSRPR